MKKCIDGVRREWRVSLSTRAALGLSYNKREFTFILQTAFVVLLLSCKSNSSGTSSRANIHSPHSRKKAKEIIVQHSIYCAKCVLCDEVGHFCMSKNQSFCNKKFS